MSLQIGRCGVIEVRRGNQNDMVFEILGVCRHLWGINRRPALWWLRKYSRQGFTALAAFSHQMILSAIWICRDVVSVLVMVPLPATGAPVASYRALKSKGGEKFG